MKDKEFRLLLIIK